MESPNGNGKTIIPVRVLFVVQQLNEFTVSQACDEFLLRYKIELSFTRMNQILNDFVADGILIKELKKSGSKNKATTHYIITIKNGAGTTS